MRSLFAFFFGVSLYLNLNGSCPWVLGHEVTDAVDKVVTTDDGCALISVYPCPYEVLRLGEDERNVVSVCLKQGAVPSLVTTDVVLKGQCYIQ